MGRHRNRVMVVCQHCGEAFETFPSELKKGSGKFCSRSCATTHRNLTDNPAWQADVRLKISLNHADISGKKNPMYGCRGQDAPGFIDGRNSFKGETYKKKLLASGAEAKCSICGATDNLNVHHIDGNRKNNNLNNLTWLCVKCHLTVAHNYMRDELGRYCGAEVKQFERG